MKKSKIFIFLLFIFITAGPAFAAIWIGSRLSEEKPMTTTENKVMEIGEPCNQSSAGQCLRNSESSCEWPATPFCTCNGSSCQCQPCWEQPCKDYGNCGSTGARFIYRKNDYVGPNDKCCCGSQYRVTKCINFDSSKPDEFGKYVSHGLDNFHLVKSFNYTNPNLEEIDQLSLCSSNPNYEPNSDKTSVDLFKEWHNSNIADKGPTITSEELGHLEGGISKLQSWITSNGYEKLECKPGRWDECNNRIYVCKYCKKKATPKNESLKCTGLRAIDPITGNQLKSTYTLQEIKDLFNSIKNSNDLAKKGKIKIEVPFSLENISITSISYTVSSNFNNSITFNSIQFSSSPATAEMDISLFDPSNFQENQTYYINAKINGQGQTSGAISSGCESTPTEPRKCTNDQPIETNPSSCCTKSFKIIPLSDEIVFSSWLMTALGDAYSFDGYEIETQKLLPNFEIVPVGVSNSAYFSTYIIAKHNGNFVDKSSFFGYKMNSYNDSNLNKFNNSSLYSYIYKLYSENFASGRCDPSIEVKTTIDNDCNGKKIYFINNKVTIPQGWIKGSFSRNNENACIVVSSDEIVINSTDSFDLNFIDGFFIGKKISTAGNKKIVINGSVIAHETEFLISNTNRESNPAELIIYDPKFLDLFRNCLGESHPVKIREVGY